MTKQQEGKISYAAIFCSQQQIISCVNVSFTSSLYAVQRMLDRVHTVLVSSPPKIFSKYFGQNCQCSLVGDVARGGGVNKWTHVRIVI